MSAVYIKIRLVENAELLAMVERGRQTILTRYTAPRAPVAAVEKRSISDDAIKRQYEVETETKVDRKTTKQDTLEQNNAQDM